MTAGADRLNVNLAELRILELFPPGRCRRILKYLAEHQPTIDDTQHSGELILHLGTDGRGQGVVSTSGPHWKAEAIEL